MMTHKRSQRSEWSRHFKGFGIAMPAAGCANAIRQQSHILREQNFFVQSPKSIVKHWLFHNQ